MTAIVQNTVSERNPQADATLGNPQPTPAEVAAVVAALNATSGVAADDLAEIDLPRERAEATLEALQRAGLAELDPGEPGPTWWASTPEARILAHLSDGKDIATRPLAERLGMDEQTTGDTCAALALAGKIIAGDNGVGRPLWRCVPPPARVTGEAVGDMLAGLSDAQALTLRGVVEGTLEHWRYAASVEYKAEQAERAGLQAGATVGKITGRPLPVPGEDGLCWEVEGPDIALAPADTFEPGQRWRFHCSHDPEFYGASDTRWLSYIFIRDGMTPADTRQAIAEAWGRRLVEDYGDDFPELPVAPVYRCEGDDTPTPWPVIRVPRELWAGCWKSCDPSREHDAAAEDAFNRWDETRERIEQAGGAA